MGQPGHSVINRLGVSNFWNFNTIGIRQDRRNFLNNFIIKQLLLMYLKFKNYFFYELCSNNKWFPLKKKILNMNIFWREKPSLIPYYKANIKIASAITRRLLLNIFSSKIQIMRYEGWLIVIWYIYNKSSKQIRSFSFTDDYYLFHELERYSNNTPLLYLKYYILSKLKTTQTSLINFI